MTWGVVSGCTKISHECDACYAYTLAENRRGTAAFPNGFDVTMRPWKLAEPQRIKAPTLIFCNSTSDWFHEEIPYSYIDQMMAAIEAAPRHRYQVLTKQPERTQEYFRTRKVPDSMWLGVTVGHTSGLWRIDMLREINARVRFISAEPLLENLSGLNLTGIAWLIGGGESGSHLMKDRVREKRALVRHGDRKVGENLWMPREDRIDWARSLRDQCATAGTAFWWKQWGGPRPESAGRELDGRVHNGMPTFVPGAMPEAYEHRKGTQFSLPVIQ